MSSVKVKQENNIKKRKASVGASDQKQNVKRVKIEQPNPSQKIQKKAKPVEEPQNNEKTKEPRRKIVSKFFEQYYKVKYSVDRVGSYLTLLASDW